MKVYSKQDGKDTFFKDGYTDLRGRFDYGQLSGASIAVIEKFAILVSHEKYGNLVREALPPTELKK